MSAPVVRIGTRGSALARAQAGFVAASLEARGRPYEIVVVETEGDRGAPDTATIDHPPTRRAVEAERAFLRAAGGGCRAPIGAVAETTGERIHLFAGYATVDGTATAFGESEGPIMDGPTLAAELARRLAERLDRASVATGARPA